MPTGKGGKGSSGRVTPKKTAPKYKKISEMGKPRKLKKISEMGKPRKLKKISEVPKKRG